MSGKKKLKARVKALEAVVAELDDAVRVLEDAREGVYRWTAPTPYWQRFATPDVPWDVVGPVNCVEVGRRDECGESACG